MNETTPITDTCPHCGAEPSPSGPDFKCGTWSLNQTGDRRSRLCEEREKRQKSELSRRRNIRRAWRLRNERNRWKYQYSYALSNVPWMHKDEKIKSMLMIGSCLFGDGIPLLKKQRDEAQARLKSLENDNFNLANALSAATRKSELWEK